MVLPTYKSHRNRLAALDIARIAAAGAVVLYHYAYLFVINGSIVLPSPTKPEEFVAPYGYLGVEFFFIISGFVISISAQGRTRAGFARARFLRLWPAFLLGLIVNLTCLALMGTSPTAATIAANLSMVPKILGFDYVEGAYWSLMFEIVFYSYVIIILIGDNFVKNARILCFSWIIISFFRNYFPSKIATLLILHYATFFVIGVSAIMHLT